MSINEAVAAIDHEIQALDAKRARLVSLRQALEAEDIDSDTKIAGSNTTKKTRRGRKPGRPKQTALKRTVGARKPNATKVGPKKRVFSPEARQRIAAAQKARWEVTKAVKKAS